MINKQYGDTTRFYRVFAGTLTLLARVLTLLGYTSGQSSHTQHLVKISNINYNIDAATNAQFALQDDDLAVIDFPPAVSSFGVEAGSAFHCTVVIVTRGFPDDKIASITIKFRR